MDTSHITEGRMDEKPLRELLADLSSDSVHLVRQETALFKKELELKAATFKRDALVLGAGAVLAFAALLTFTAALVLVLRHVMPVSLAAGLIAVAYAIGGGVLLAQGKRKLSGETVAPEESIDSVRHDVQVIRRAIS